MGEAVQRIVLESGLALNGEARARFCEGGQSTYSAFMVMISYIIINILTFGEEFV